MAMMTGQGPFGHAPAGAFNRRLSGDEHVDLEVVGRPQPRPRTPWAAPRWWEWIADMEARL